jgi:hypothetical protein
MEALAGLLNVGAVVKASGCRVQERAFAVEGIAVMA